MAKSNSVGFTFDADSVFAGLDVLADDAYSAARHMGVAVGAAFRDEAKANVRSRTGNLRRSIYLAFDSDSTNTNIKYTVSWNKARLGKHGYLVEFGHRRTNVIVKRADGKWVATKEKLATPEWVRARPFLRPAYSSVLPRAMGIAAAAGKRRLAGGDSVGGAVDGD